MRIAIRLWAWLTGGRLVWLRDFDGQVTLSIARTDPWGDLVAERHLPFNIHPVRLLPDGTIGRGSYVSAWRDAE